MTDISTLPTGLAVLRMNVSHRKRTYVMREVAGDGVPVRIWGGRRGILDAAEGLIVKANRVDDLLAKFERAITRPRDATEFGLWMGGETSAQRDWLVEHGALRS